MGMPDRTVDDEFMYGFLRDAKGARCCEGGVVRDKGCQNAAIAGEGKAEERAGKIS